MSNHIYKSKDKVFMGVSGGLAKHLNLSVDVVRILWVLAFFVSAGTAIVLYIVLGFVLPDEPKEDDNKSDIYDI